jgi:hypothetical protein
MRSASNTDAIQGSTTDLLLGLERVLMSRSDSSAAGTPECGRCSCMRYPPPAQPPQPLVTTGLYADRCATPEMLDGGIHVISLEVTGDPFIPKQVRA